MIKSRRILLVYFTIFGKKGRELTSFCPGEPKLAFFHLFGVKFGLVCVAIYYTFALFLNRDT